MGTSIAEKQLTSLPCTGSLGWWGLLLGTLLKCLEVDAMGETGSVLHPDSLLSSLLAQRCLFFMPVLEWGAWRGDPIWGSYSVRTLFLGQTTSDVTRHKTNMDSLFWILPNAVMFIFFIVRHLNLSTTLATNTQCNCLQCTYAQGMELKQISPKILDVFPRLMKAAQRVSVE